MSQATPQSAAPQAPWIVRNQDMVPVICAGLLTLGFACYKGSDQGAFLYVMGKNLLMPIGNLGLLLYLILSRALPQLVDHLKERRQEIRSGISSFNEREDEIAARYHKIKEKLENVEDEKKDILERAKGLAKKEEEELREAADHKAQRRIEDAKTQIAQELHGMQAEMQRELLEKSFDAAWTLLHDELGAQDQERLQEDYVTRLGADS